MRICIFPFYFHAQYEYPQAHTIYLHAIAYTLVRAVQHTAAVRISVCSWETIGVFARKALLQSLLLYTRITCGLYKYDVTWLLCNVSRRARLVNIVWTKLYKLFDWRILYFLLLLLLFILFSIFFIFFCFFTSRHADYRKLLCVTCSVFKNNNWFVKRSRAQVWNRVFIPPVREVAHTKILPHINQFLINICLNDYRFYLNYKCLYWRKRNKYWFKFFEVFALTFVFRQWFKRNLKSTKRTWQNMFVIQSSIHTVSS